MPTSFDQMYGFECDIFTLKQAKDVAKLYGDDVHRTSDNDHRSFDVLASLKCVQCIAAI